MDLAESKKGKTRPRSTRNRKPAANCKQSILAVLTTLDPAKTLTRTAASLKTPRRSTGRSQALRSHRPLRKAIISALSERDPTADICTDANGNPEPDPELRDTESVAATPEYRAPAPHRLR